MLTDDQLRVQYDSWQTAIKTCMANRGFEYPVGTYESDAAFARQTHPLNLEWAGTHGYHLEFVQQPIPPQGGDVAAYDLALAGNESTEGCGDMASQEVFSPYKEYDSQAMSLVAGFSDAVGGFLESSEGVELVRAWSECMRDAGYVYSSPEEPRGIYQDAPEVTEEELQTRLQDIECNHQVGLTAAQSSFERARAEAWLDSNAEAIAELISLRDQLIGG